MKIAIWITHGFMQDCNSHICSRKASNKMLKFSSFIDSQK